MTLKTILTALVGGTASFTLAHGIAAAEWDELEVADSVTIYARDADGAVMIGCSSEGDLALGFLLDDADLEAAVNNPSDRWKLRRGAVLIDGDEVFNHKFVYKPASKIAETNHPRAVVEIYHGAIEEQQVEFDLGRHGGLVMDLPGPNGAFESFADECLASD